MEIYTYKAKDEKGRMLKGRIEAPDEKLAAGVLRERKLFVINIAKRQSFSLGRFFKNLQKAGLSDVLEFTNELSTMITAGLPLTDAMEILRSQVRNPAMGAVLSDLLDRVRGGASLADSLFRHNDVFSPIYIALVKAGEAAGVLDKVMTRLSDNLEKDREFRGKIKGAMIYPIIVIVAMIGISFIMLIFVIPTMMSFYKDFNAQLPLPTVILMAVSDFTLKYLFFIIAVPIILIFFLRRWLGTEEGKMAKDKLLFSIPLIGKLTKGVALTEFTRTLSLLVSAGIPIIESLHIVSEAVNNKVYEMEINEAAMEVEKGYSLGAALSRYENFPPVVTQMVKVGEESGKTDEILGKLSKYYESETELLVKGLTTAIEPLIMIILGIGVAFLMAAVLLPMYSLMSSI